MSLTLPDNIVLGEGVRWIVCEKCDDGHILILGENSPSCGCCDSMDCPKHLNKCETCKDWACDDCMDNLCKTSEHVMCDNCTRICQRAGCDNIECKRCMVKCNWCQKDVCYDCTVSCGICGEYTHICKSCADNCKLCGALACRCCWDVDCVVCRKRVPGTFCRKCHKSENVHTLH